MILDISVIFLLVYLAPSTSPPGAPWSQPPGFPPALLTTVTSGDGARQLGSVFLNGSIYNFMVIWTGVNDNGRKNNPMGRMTLVRWVRLSDRGVGYGQSEASLESTLTQQPPSET